MNTLRWLLVRQDTTERRLVQGVVILGIGWTLVVIIQQALGWLAPDVLNWISSHWWSGSTLMPIFIGVCLIFLAFFFLLNGRTFGKE